MRDTITSDAWSWHTSRPGVEHSVLVLPAWLGLIAVAAEASRTAVSGTGFFMPAALVSASAYALLATGIAQLRIGVHQLLSPRAWLMYVGGLQLVLLPLLVQAIGPSKYTLPVVPNHGSINHALLLQALAFSATALAFCRPRAWRERPRLDWLPRRAPSASLPAFAAAGLLGLALKFPNPVSVLDYLAGRYVRAPFASGDAGFRGTLVTLLLPFLAFFFVLAITRMIDGSARRLRVRGPVAAVLLIGMLASSALFDYNRASIAVPLVALVAVYAHAQAVFPWRAFTAAGLAGGLLVVGVSAVRTHSNEVSLASQGIQATAKVPLGVTEAQVYGSSAQFLAFALDHPPPRHWPPRTVISSALYPVPKIGKNFRRESGPVVYNVSVYGDARALDLIVPFQAELYWDFGVPGVLAGFFAVGLLVRRCDEEFLSATATALGRYVAMFVGVWTCFLLLGSLSVLVQVLLYASAPIWILIGSKLTAPDHDRLTRARVS